MKILKYAFNKYVYGNLTVVKITHLGLPWQIAFIEVGYKLEIGFGNKHAFSRFIEPNKAYWLNETILLVSKFK